MQTDFKIFENQHPRIIKYIPILASYWPYRFFCTISFQYPFSDKKGVLYAIEHLKRLNHILNNIDLNNSINHTLTGIAVLEHTTLKKKLGKDGRTIKDLGSCHFHFLLRDHPNLDADPNVGLSQMTSAWDKSARSLNYKRNKKLVSKNGTDVKLFQTQGIYGYVLKGAKDYNWKYQERLFLLDQQGLIPIDLSQF